MGCLLKLLAATIYYNNGGRLSRRIAQQLVILIKHPSNYDVLSQQKLLLN